MQNTNTNINNVSSSAEKPQINYTGIVPQLEQALRSDIQKLFLMVQQGVITSEQGQSLLKMLINKANALEEFKKTNDESADMGMNNTPQPESSIDLFNKENPDFFKPAGRGDLLNYIKNLDVDKDEISKIAQLAQNLEQSAVDEYLKQAAYDKNLNEENSIAKRKLTSYAQNAPSGGDFSKIFTRADIGKMSGDEFTKNEKIINEQLRQGLIK